MNDEQIIQLFFTRNEDAIRQTDDRYGAKLYKAVGEYRREQGGRTGVCQ